LHTDTSTYVKIYTRTHPCKSKICLEARLLQLTSRTFHRTSRIDALRHGVVCQKLYSENVSYVKVV